jgi:hypothetical protein
VLLLPDPLWEIGKLYVKTSRVDGRSQSSLPSHFRVCSQQATDQELICDPLDHDRRGSDNGEIHVRRDRIREIRVEKREGANMLAGAGGGAGLGSLLGALLIPGARGPSAYLLGLGGASIGAHQGRNIHILHGKLIYRRSVEARDSPNGTQAIAQTSP